MGAFDEVTGKQWRDRFGRWNRRGTYVAVNGKLVKRRGFRKPPRVRSAIVNRKRHRGKPWRDKEGKLNTRGTYKKIGDDLIKMKGFRKTKPLADEEGEVQDRGIEIPKIPKGVTKQGTGRTGAQIFTVFRAGGTFGQDVDEYDENLFWGEVEELGVPAQFYSHHGFFLGQVRWEGRVDIETLISRLNGTLQFRGMETANFDFRTTYPRWSYRYKVVERIGPSVNILRDISDSRG